MHSPTVHWIPSRNATIPPLAAGVKLVPMTVTWEPMAPLAGVNPRTARGPREVGASTVKLDELLALPLTLETEIGPVVAVAGTVTVRLMACPRVAV